MICRLALSALSFTTLLCSLSLSHCSANLPASQRSVASYERTCRARLALTSSLSVSLSVVVLLIYVTLRAECTASERQSDCELVSRRLVVVVVVVVAFVCVVHLKLISECAQIRESAFLLSR